MVRAWMCFAFCASVAWGQSFEVVSIKPAAPQRTDGRYFSGCPNQNPARITCSNMALPRMIAIAYQISAPRISGLKPPYPAYDIIANLPDGTTKEQIQVMWQNLLAERFHLAVHRETKVVSAYVLTVAKGGLKAKESAAQPESDAGEEIPIAGPRLDADGFPIVAPGGNIVIYKNNAAHFAAASWTMEQLVSWLEVRLEADTKENRPVVDATGLIGKYDFKVMFALGMVSPGDVPELPNALESQLGLKLEQKQTRIEILVVDHADKSPIEN